MPSRTISAVIFDLDGTLIDSKAVTRHAFVTAYAEVVCGTTTPPFDEYCSHLGRSFPEIMRVMGLPQEMHPAFVRESARKVADIELFSGMAETLDLLRERGIPMSIATGKDKARTMAILENLGLSTHFSVVVASDEVARAKPAPDMALQIADQLGLTPRNTLFVGDALADLLCGQSAGMQTAVALWDKPSAAVLQHPVDFRLKQPADILSLLHI